MSYLSFGNCHSIGDGGNMHVLGTNIRPGKPGQVGGFEHSKGCRCLELGVRFEIVKVWLSHCLDPVSEAP